MPQGPTGTSALPGRSQGRSRELFASGARPWPITGFTAEAGFYGIAVNVVDRCTKVSIVANESVPVFAHPDMVGIGDF